MEVFLELLSFGCYVDIQHYEVYNILSNAARLYKRILHCCSDVTLLSIMQVTTAVLLHLSAVNCKFRYGNCHYVWEDNIKLDLQEVGCGGVDWVELAEDRDRWRTLVHVVLNIRVP